MKRDYSQQREMVDSYKSENQRLKRERFDIDAQKQRLNEEIGNLMEANTVLTQKSEKLKQSNQKMKSRF